MTAQLTDYDQHPIYINLTGEYNLPEKKGSVTGDLRLATLDAFLATLNQNVSGNENLENGMTNFLAKVASTITGSNDANIILEIKSKLIPATNELNYTFKFNIANNDQPVIDGAEEHW